MAFRQQFLGMHLQSLSFAVMLWARHRLRFSSSAYSSFEQLNLATSEMA